MSDSVCPGGVHQSDLGRHVVPGLCVAQGPLITFVRPPEILEARVREESDVDAVIWMVMTDDHVGESSAA
jgi:hypothetical protein